MRIQNGVAVRLAWIMMIALFVLPACGSAKDELRVREPALAGRWYEGERERLQVRVDVFCQSAADAQLHGRVCAVIVPHAGYVWSGRVAGHAYRQVKRGTVRRVIMLAPSHYAGFRGFSILDVDAWRTPLGDVTVDAEVCKMLRTHKLHVANDSWHKQEHSLEIQLPFLQRAVGNFKLVPILVGQITAADAEAIAAAIRPYVTDDTLVVVSSDFTHYGPNYRYLPFSEDAENKLLALDMGAMNLILKKDFAGYMAYLQKTGITICGRFPIAIMLKLLPQDARGKLLKYDTSGRMNGNYANSVSYMAAAFTSGAKSADGLSVAEQKILLQIARATLDTRIKSGRIPGGLDKLYKLTPALKAKSGVFVTLKKQDQLRGCIGKIGYPEAADKLPPLYECVQMMTVEAATRDPRFPAVKANELKNIYLEISALTIAREVGGWEDFQVGRDGIIIRKGWKSAVFLPQVAPEQGWSREMTLSQLCRKAGLEADEWRNPGMKFFTFTAQVFDEGLIRNDLPVPKNLIR